MLEVPWTTRGCFRESKGQDTDPWESAPRKFSEILLWLEATKHDHPRGEAVALLSSCQCALFPKNAFLLSKIAHFSRVVLLFSISTLLFPGIAISFYRKVLLFSRNAFSFLKNALLFSRIAI